MARSDEEKQDARSRNRRAANNLLGEFECFRKQLQSGDTECLDEAYAKDLITVRQEMLQIVLQMNPIIDEGIKSISTQSVSGRLTSK